jgi:hypothetical protein
MQSTVPFPVVISQVLVPAAVGRKRTVALTACPALREYGPPPVRRENSGHGELIVPPKVTPPALVKVKVRSTECPTSTLPKFRLASSSFGVGGCVPSSLPQPLKKSTVTIRTVSRASRLERVPKPVFMSTPHHESDGSASTHLEKSTPKMIGGSAIQLDRDRARRSGRTKSPNSTPDGGSRGRKDRRPDHREVPGCHRARQ